MGLVNFCWLRNPLSLSAHLRTFHYFPFLVENSCWKQSRFIYSEMPFRPSCLLFAFQFCNSFYTCSVYLVFALGSCSPCSHFVSLCRLVYQLIDSFIMAVRAIKNTIIVISNKVVSSSDYIVTNKHFTYIFKFIQIFVGRGAQKLSLQCLLRPQFSFTYIYTSSNHCDRRM